jgi:hypothetical protein
MKPYPPDDPRALAQSRRRIMLTAAGGMLVLSAIIIVLLPIRLPIPLRLAVACIDLIAAATIWVLLRQQAGR